MGHVLSAFSFEFSLTGFQMINSGGIMQWVLGFKIIIWTSAMAKLLFRLAKLGNSLLTWYEVLDHYILK